MYVLWGRENALMFVEGMCVLWGTRKYLYFFLDENLIINFVANMYILECSMCLLC